MSNHINIYNIQNIIQTFSALVRSWLDSVLYYHAPISSQLQNLEFLASHFVIQLPS